MILDTIVARKREEVAELRGRGLMGRPAELEPPRGFIRALTDSPGVAIIAEAKKASPSKGVIAPDFDPIAIAEHYQASGANAMSVLTDVDFFQGALAYIPLVRKVVDLPVLRKDFIIDPLQIQEANMAGADAVLLIAAILETEQMKEYRLMAESMGMDVLVEVHDEHEVESALKAESRLLGINNRNLNDFTVSLETTFRLLREIPDSIPVVSESGITTVEDIKRLKEHNVTAALIGESLMRSGPQGELLKEFAAL